MSTAQAVRVRVYCPGCGTVRGPDGYRARPSRDDVRVHQHTVVTPEMGSRTCPGGAADPQEDRAP